LPTKSVNPYVRWDQKGARPGPIIEQVGESKERTVLASASTNNFNGENNGANLVCAIKNGMGD
jgi:hypothetical protein